jgi:uncharacterized protein (DUF305 family)
MNKRALAAAAFLALLGSPAMAAEDPHAGHAMMAAPAGDTANPSSKEFSEVNAKMHKDMNISMSGDTDVDFIKGMIPHHQGAVDMARIQLKYGKDPEARKLAEGIIAGQEKEIAWMKEWLAKKGK